MSLDPLLLSCRAEGALVRLGCRTVDDVAALTPAALLALPNCGKKSVAEIRAALGRVGRDLLMPKVGKAETIAALAPPIPQTGGLFFEVVQIVAPARATIDTSCEDDACVRGVKCGNSTQRGAPVLADRNAADLQKGASMLDSHNFPQAEGDHILPGSRAQHPIVGAIVGCGFRSVVSVRKRSRALVLTLDCGHEVVRKREVAPKKSHCEAHLRHKPRERRKGPPERIVDALRVANGSAAIAARVLGCTHQNVSAAIHKYHLKAWCDEMKAAAGPSAEERAARAAARAERDARLAKQRQRRARAAGLCGCGRAPIPGRKRCQPCRDRGSAAGKRRYAAAKAAGLCPVCREAQTGGRYCVGCLERRVYKYLPSRRAAVCADGIGGAS